MEPCCGVTARCRATRQALNGWHPGTIHMSPPNVQEVTNGRFMRWPLTPHCRQCTMRARMYTSAALTKELLDLFDAEKEPSNHIYHVTMREKRMSWLIFFGWFPGEGLKKKTALACEGNFLSVKCFSGLQTRWQACFILENQAWLHIQSADMLTHHVCCLDLSFIYRKSSPMNLYCVKEACFHSCSFFFTRKSHSHLDTCVSPPEGKRRFNWSVQM